MATPIGIEFERSLQLGKDGLRLSFEALCSGIRAAGGQVPPEILASYVLKYTRWQMASLPFTTPRGD